MLHGHLYVADNYDAIYHDMLRDVYQAPNHEIIGTSFCLQDPKNVAVLNDVRNFELDKAQAFFDWIMSGSEDSSVLRGKNKGADKFNQEVEGRNAFYGPRILKQIDEIINELYENADTRRGCILILDAKDQLFLAPKRNSESNIEYPCTISLNYWIRNGFLYSSALMRSNNMVNTVCYDVFNFTKLQEHICNTINTRIALQGKNSSIALGYYFHYIQNAHIIKSEIELAGKILKESYGEEVISLMR